MPGLRKINTRPKTIDEVALSLGGVNQALNDLSLWCVVATTANITLSGEQTIDGVAVVEGDMVLVKNQTTTAENGIWRCFAGTWRKWIEFTGPVLYRAIFVAKGTTNGLSTFYCTADNTVALGAGAGGTSNHYGCAVYHSSDQSIANNGLASAIVFDSERWDDGGLHSTSVNTGRITVNVAGIWIFSANIRWEANDVGARAIAIRANGSTTFANQTFLAADGGNTTNCSVTGLWDCAANDYFEVTVYQQSGGSLNVLALSAVSPEFRAEWLRS